MAAAWVAASGGTVAEELVEVHEFPDGTGRGVRARRAVKKGAVLARVPVKAQINIDTVLKLGSKDLKHAMRNIKNKVADADHVVAIFLMWASVETNHRHLPAEFVAYLKSLPAVATGPAALHQSMFWTEDELEWIKGCDAFEIAHQLKAQIRQDFAKIVSDVLLVYPKLFPLDGQHFTHNTFKWALALVWSRGMDFTVTRTGRKLRTIVPFVDMANTDFVGRPSHTFNKDTVELRARQDVAEGEQVFIQYAPTSSTRLLQLYGFVPRPPKNKITDHITLWVVMNPDSERFDEVSKTLAVLMPDFDPNTSPFLLTPLIPLPDRVILALHVQRGFPAPTKVGSTWSGLSISVLRELNDALKGRKQSYYNKGDRMADLKLLMDESWSGSERERLALHLRLSENAILDKTLAALEKLIEAYKDSEQPQSVMPPPAPAANDAQEDEDDAVAALDAMD